MSRTFRRKRERHEYYWVLHDWDFNLSFRHRVMLDPHSKAGRKAIARFHSDKAAIVGRSAPRWYRKVSDHQIRTSNDRMFRSMAQTRRQLELVVTHCICANKIMAQASR